MRVVWRGPLPGTHAQLAPYKNKNVMINSSYISPFPFQGLRGSLGQQQEKEVLMTALTQLEDKNQTLKQTLSDETKLKLDLFSALGEAKRQLEIKTSQLL